MIDDDDDDDDDHDDDDDDDDDDESPEGAEISSPPPLNGATDSLRPTAMFTIHLCTTAQCTMPYFKETQKISAERTGG